MTHQRAVTLGIRQLVTVQAADGANDGARDLVAAGAVLRQGSRGAIAGVEGAQELRVAIGEEIKDARETIVNGEAAVSAALHTQLLP